MSQGKKHSDFVFAVASNLIAACFVAGLIISVVYFITAPVSAKTQEEMKQQSMMELIKDAEHFEAVPDHEGWFAAKKGGKSVAYIVPSSTRGYGGTIKMLVAVKADGTVIDYSIQEHNETPGLGDNAQKMPFRGQFKGKDSAHLKVTKDPTDTEDIQAMTGATISSRAVTKAVKDAVDRVNEYQKEIGGGTK